MTPLLATLLLGYVPVPTLAPAQGFTDLILGKGAVVSRGDLITFEANVWLQDNGQHLFELKEGMPPQVMLVDTSHLGKALTGMKLGGQRIVILNADQPGPFASARNSRVVYDIQVLRIDKKGQKPMLEIEELKPGEGAEAKAGDTVEIHYTGTFINGEKFDSSVDRGETFSFKLGSKQVIAGFDMGVTGMKAGGKRKIVIPHELGYGDRAVGPIPPKSTLVFELELVSIAGS